MLSLYATKFKLRSSSSFYGWKQKRLFVRDRSFVYSQQQSGRTQEKVAKFTATKLLVQSAVHQRLTKSDNVPVQFVLGTDSFSRWMHIAANVRYRLSDCWGIAGLICLWNVNPLFTMIHDSRYSINCISERDESKSNSISDWWWESLEMRRPACVPVRYLSQLHEIKKCSRLRLFHAR